MTSPKNSAEKDYGAAYKKALDLLAFRDRTVHEMREALLKREFAAEDVEKVIKRLGELSYLDDARYAEQMVKNRLQMGDAGVYGLRRRLQSRGLSNEVSEAAVAAVEEETQAAHALTFARKEFGAKLRAAKGDERVAMHKVSQALVRRGYAWEIAKTAVRRAAEELALEAEEDME